MLVAKEIEAARSAAAGLPRPLGFVPTMGALHAGHLRLIELSRARCAATVVSSFVNPAQFAPGEDLERYPRDPVGDREKLERSKADLVFAPRGETMYPPDFSTFVDVGDIGTRYEGSARPTHFRGVATVVTKLLHITAPNVLFLGQKDAQQMAVLRKLVRDLDFEVRIELGATVRESDGLALSSRNAYLSAQERAAAPSLHEALQAMLAALRNGAQISVARQAAQQALRAPGIWEYIDLVDSESFLPLAEFRRPAFIVGAARFGTTRLIDNLMVVA